MKAAGARFSWAAHEHKPRLTWSGTKSSLLAALMLLLMNLTGAQSHVHSDYEQPDPMMEPVELEALFQTMESLTTDIDWRQHYPHPCSSTPWPGIHCEQQDDGLSHVTRIDFGSLPNSTCKKNASMSPSILNLRSLRTLFIINCFTTTSATILPGISKLAPSLQMLSLRGNPHLTGEILAELGHLSKLEVLSLAQNGLTGGIPSQLGNLAKLEHLDLSFNRLRGELPTTLGTLKSVSILDVNNNMLDGEIPPELGDLTGLQKLDLSSNALTGRIPRSLGKLKSLKFLALSENELTGELPKELSELLGIEYLILHSNPFQSRLPGFWGSLTNLSELSLGNSGYFGAMPDSFGELTYLSELSLEDNFLNGSIPVSVGKLPNMYHLNLSNNHLSGPVPFPREFLYRLGENLDLRGNAGLCLTTQVPRNVSTKNLSTCNGKSSSLDVNGAMKPFTSILLLLPLFVALFF